MTNGARGWRDDGGSDPAADLRYVEAHGHEHNEAAWGARTGPLLEWLCPRIGMEGEVAELRR